MADDHRYDWLDDAAAERLLTGSPLIPPAPTPTPTPASPSPSCGTDAGADGVGGVDGAARLEAALRVLRTPAHVAAGPGSEPLPGEEAALAAFREARVARAAATARPAKARFRLRRPARAALALTLAGCAVGGVAVAAGTGVLPSPFRSPGRQAAAPAAGLPTAAETDGGRSTTPHPGTPGSPTPGASGTPRPYRTPGATGTPGPGSTGGTATPGDPDHEPDHGSSATPPHDGGTDKGGPATADPARALAVRLCQTFLQQSKRRGGGLDDEDARTLERSAGGAAGVRAYCERLLAAEGDDGDGDEGDIARNGGGRGGSNPRSTPGSRPQAGLPGLPQLPGVTFSGSTAL
ncbi:hypothetical protein GCM10010218_32240 [Streptomyces mashuensis]|uniref:Extensin n=1 Tax=Streptomyces mashuensis TaxID=33904 RepID=A0A919B3X8_9ACTN|nr:hypothetical protein [Streptomyces mashuensis]GHF48313.1 hypothetical protein GCM10010218_32240 [Streptomyces mashuensis]